LLKYVQLRNGSTIFMQGQKMNQECSVHHATWTGMENKLTDWQWLYWQYHLLTVLLLTVLSI